MPNFIKNYSNNFCKHFLTNSNLFGRYLLGFFSALSFLSTIPLPANITRQNWRQGFWAVPIVGLLLGCLVGGFLSFLISLNLLPFVAVILTIAFSLLLTGGLHEDGFADFCDGYFAKRKSKDILRIMKESRLGVFGVAGLFLLLYSKLTSFVLLYELPYGYIILWTGLSYAMARWTMLIGFALPLPLKSNSLTNLSGKPPIWPLIIGGQVVWLLLLVPELWGYEYINLWHAFSALAALIFGLVLIFFLLHRHKQLPLTGDALGFLEQVAEVCYLLFFLSYFGFFH